MAEPRHEFLMPSLGADMEDGTLVEWLKKPGDQIARGDVLAVVETEKGAIEIEIFSDGMMEEILVNEGEMVPVGRPLALIAGGKEAPVAAAPPPPRPAHKQPGPPKKPKPSAGGPVTRPDMRADAGADVSADVGSGAHLRASPAARAFAAEQGIDLITIGAGSGPAGAVLRSDLDKQGEGRPERPKPSRKVKPGLDMEKMRHAIAAAMARSKREIPHYYLGAQINLRCATDWLAEMNIARPPETRLLMNVLFLKAVARALVTFPRFNGHYGEDGFVPANGVHIGTAIAIRGGGLVAPAIHDCHEKSIDQIMTDLRDLVARTRTGALRSSEITGSGITVTSLGTRGVETVFGVIFPPLVAIVGFGAPKLTPFAHPDGALAAEPVVMASLAADHRVTDGHMGSQFLAKIDALLQEPEKL